MGERGKGREREREKRKRQNTVQKGSDKETAT